MVGVTLDTNIFVSALEFGGINARLPGMARAGVFRVDVSDPILEELIVVLRDDFKMGGLQTAPRAVCDRSRVKVHPDLRQDLLRLGEYRDIKIIRTVDFMRHGMARLAGPFERSLVISDLSSGCLLR